LDIETDKAKRVPCLAVLGTGSEVGKSIIVTGLCRLFANQGVKVVPYKAQNMSNNSGVTPEGLEMGRAQIVQAEAARIPPHVDMNPILLKPTSEIGSQVVLLGAVLENITAGEYHQKKKKLFATACAALDRLRRDYDLVILEGAGSCAEVNLMDTDLVNFRMAEYAQAPVILVADIHRGGVFAQIVGTLECLPPRLSDRVAGFLINRFRGDIQLFENGAAWIEQKTGKTSFGTVPWYDHFHIEAEDSVVIEHPRPVSVSHTGQAAVAVIRMPHISNFTDFDPLIDLDGLDLHFIERPQDLLMFSGVILPGSKNTRFDLEWLKSIGWVPKLTEFAKTKGNILGICGGYQMMGQSMHDPDGLEGTPGSTEGLGFLPLETTLQAPKTTTQTRFRWQGIEGAGYEIHMGRSRRMGGRPLFSVIERNGKSLQEEDGCEIGNNGIMGTYVHGLFDVPGITRLWLDRIGCSDVEVSAAFGPESRDKSYELLAKHLSTYMDIEKIQALIPWYNY